MTTAETQAAPPDCFDLVVHGGEIVTSEGRFTGDVAVKDGRIAAIAERISGGARRIDAAGRLVLPGGIETHAHVAQESSSGIMGADGYESASISAAFGGNTCIVPFAAQHRGQSIDEVLRIYGERAAGSLLDYSWHLIVTDPSPEALSDQLPRAFAAGVTSFKVFMTYDLMNLGDAGMLDILSVAKAHGAMTMVHAENDAMVKWMNARLAAGGHAAPRYHAVSRPEIAEAEAIHRAVSLARLVDAPLFIVHVSTAAGAKIVAEAQAEGAAIWAETCPQYLAFTAADLDRPGMEGAKYVCSPPVRSVETQSALWDAIRRGVFTAISSDHAPYRFDETGKFLHGRDIPYPKIANGMPGIGARLPWLFTEGVVAGRITLEEFVKLTAVNSARLFGLTRKGRIAPGMDADLAVWDPEASWILTHASQHDAMDYTPFEGMRMQGRPETVIARGDVVVAEGALQAAPGRGRFVPRAPVDRRGVPGTQVRELDPARNFGAAIAP